MLIFLSAYKTGKFSKVGNVVDEGWLSYFLIMDLNEINILLEKFHQLNIPDSIDWEKFNHFSIVYHSTSIEGYSLTDLETQLLLDENLTAKGKSFDHHLQTKDHYQALLYTVSLFKNIAEQVMKNTGTVRNTVIGSFDSGLRHFWTLWLVFKANVPLSRSFRI